MDLRCHLSVIRTQQQAGPEGKDGVWNENDDWVSGLSSCSSRGSRVVKGAWERSSLGGHGKSEEEPAHFPNLAIPLR